MTLAATTPDLAPPAPVLRRVHMWQDRQPHDAALNMALDEALLRLAGQPVLRFYRWDRPAVSFGCFVSFAEARAAAASPETALVRRWTGGGIVPHGEGVDWTYSLIVPRAEPLATMGTSASYRAIHHALAAALRRAGVAAALAEAPVPGLGGLCFQAPVHADLLCAGQKIAGAAQRRTRHGLLHQGSVQWTLPPPEVAAFFAEALAEEVIATSEAPARWPEVLPLATRLAEEKYRSSAWLTRVP